MDDEDFRPRLGRMRDGGRARRGRAFLRQVLAATALAGGLRRPPARRFDGSRIGRGAATGRVLGLRDRFGGARGRRAVVKTRLVRLGGKGIGAARAHLRYIQRDGVGPDGESGILYGRDTGLADGKAFLARCEGDRHQFRFILSAEDGDQYPDLGSLTRRFMAQLEADLGTRLDWVAADHRDTGHPHSHVMLRGVDEAGGNLVIAPDYIAHGMRERLAGLVSLDLGPRSDLEIERKLRLEMRAERLTGLDRQLLREADAAHEVDAGHRDPFRRALRAGRLRKLEALGLASERQGGRWRLAPDLEERLRRLGERGDIVRAMQRALGNAELERAAAGRVVHGREPDMVPVVGRVVGRGLADELADRHYLIVDGTDGRVHYLDIGSGDAVEPLAEGAIVRVAPAAMSARPADRIVAEVAAANGGIYGIEAHLRYDPSASEAFAAAHVRRLEALRRGGVGVERLPDGSWRVPAELVAQVEAFQRQGSARRPLDVELLSPVPLQRLPRLEAATWLDRQLTGADPVMLRDAGFGREVRSNLALRRLWLIESGFARDLPGGPAYPDGMLDALRRRELARTAAQLGGQLGLSYVEAAPAMRFVGTIERRVDLASGRFALVANSREFSLVPWRPGLERRLGRSVELRLRGSGLSWTLGRERAGPEIG
jgi:type IV secretory pathway VirD2 relaxase